MTGSSRLPAPAQGVRAVHQGGGWCYVTWDAVPGATGYDQDLPDGHGSGPIPEPKTGIFAIPPGDRRTARIRATGREGASAWVAVTVALDAVSLAVRIVEVKEEDGPGPRPPAVPQITRVSAGHDSVAAWWTAFDAHAWDAELVDAAGDPVQGQGGLTEPGAVWTGLTGDTVYGVRARAFAAGSYSAWSPTTWTRTTPDGSPPAPPTGLRTHCVTDTSAKAQWNDAAGVDEWIVRLDDDPATELVTVTPLVRLTGLSADTGYTVSVVAVAAGRRSDAVAHSFATLDTVLPPDDDPPPDIGADLPAPRGLTVTPLSGGRVDVSWTDERPDGSDRCFYVVAANGREWERTDGAHTTVTIPDGAGRAVVAVYGVMGAKLTGIARAAADRLHAAGGQEVAE